MTPAIDNPLSLGDIDRQIASTEAQIYQLTVQLANAKKDVQQWSNANSSLSLSAQKARSETQSMGRGLGGALLGSQYRASRRREAACKNAGIAREVAAKRAEIKQKKQNAQEVVSQIQSKMSLSKDKLKVLKSQKNHYPLTNHLIKQHDRLLTLLLF